MSKNEDIFIATNHATGGSTSVDKSRKMCNSKNDCSWVLFLCSLVGNKWYGVGRLLLFFDTVYLPGNW